MADGRMLKKRISQSHKFAALKTNNARLLYLMMFPHLDIRGRLEADPKIIRGAVTPLLSFSNKKIRQYLADMHDVGLVLLYKGNDQWYLEVTKFLDFQSLRATHEAESQCPDPPNGELPKLDRSSTAQVKLSKVKLSKVKEYTSEFEKFWQVYPRRWIRGPDKYVKLGKYQASVEFEKLDIETQRKAYIAAKASENGEYVKDAHRWLNKRGFDDYPPPKKLATTPQKTSSSDEPKVKRHVSPPKMKKVPPGKTPAWQVEKNKQEQLANLRK